MLGRTVTVVARSKEEARLIKNERQREYSKRTGYAAQRKYDKGNSPNKNSVSIAFRLYSPSDMDIIEHLKDIENKSAYIKELIRGDIDADSK